MEGSVDFSIDFSGFQMLMLLHTQSGIPVNVIMQSTEDIVSFSEL